MKKTGKGARGEKLQAETPDVSPATDTSAPASAGEQAPGPVVDQVYAVRLSGEECAEIAAVYAGELPVDRLGTLVHKMHLFGYRAPA